MTKEHYKYNKNHHHLPKRKVTNFRKANWRRNRVRELHDDILSMRNNAKPQVAFLGCF
jgi:uncharacterized lipoprotein YddW (UPF0748 family)